MKFRVWCLTWEENEEAGMDVVAMDGHKPTNRTTIYVSAWNLENAKEAAEAYAHYVHSHRDGWEASWPLTFRVRNEDGTTEDYEVEREVVPEFTARKAK